MKDIDNKTVQKKTGASQKQKGPFKKRRAGVVLTKDEVKEIKEGRKKLRKEMRETGIKSKKEFELTASSLGLYFDKNSRFAIILWFFSGRGFLSLAALALLSMLLLYGFSAITELRGHFTISMSDKMFKEGFSISETKDFKNPTSHLFSTPAENVPCISIVNIPQNVDEIDGAHHDNYFAYTFYVKNEGETVQNMSWQLRINSDNKNVSEAAWVMLFVDGKMSLYAHQDSNGNQQMLPSKEDNTKGYIKAPFYDVAFDPQNQFEVIKQTGNITYWRIKTDRFLTDSVVENGLIHDFNPKDVHKFTVVIWLEGDDPDCTDEIIGGHLGMDFYMFLEGESN